MSFLLLIPPITIRDFRLIMHVVRNIAYLCLFVDWNFQCIRLFLTYSPSVIALLTGFKFAEDKGTVVDDFYVGDYSAYAMDGLKVEISVQNNDANYFYCNQDMMRCNLFVFPAIASNIK